MIPIDRKQAAILRVLESAARPLGAGRIAKELLAYGVELEERAVRYHLEYLDEHGLTEATGRPGRRITERGRRELGQARVADKVNLVLGHIESFAYLTTFRPQDGGGRVPLNISTVPAADVRRALKAMRPALNSRYATSRRIRLYEAGELVGNQFIPEGSVGIGTVCSVAINGVLLKAGIPVQSLFGGLLAIDRNKPCRFIEVVHYGGTSLDPIEVFIKGGSTSVRDAVATGTGVIGASFREFPLVAREHVLAVVQELVPWGITGVIEVGAPSSPLFEIPVGPGRCGMVISAGLNAIAAVEESGIPTRSHAMTTTVDYEELTDVNDIDVS